MFKFHVNLSEIRLPAFGLNIYYSYRLINSTFKLYLQKYIYDDIYK